MAAIDRRQIVMQFTIPPSPEDVKVIVEQALEHLPEELAEYTDTLTVSIEELAEEALEQEFDLDDPYEMVCLYRDGNQIAPGIKSKVANDDDLLTVFRLPLLNLWAETNDDINIVARQVLIEELGHHFGFEDAEIEEMTARHYQGML